MSAYLITMLKAVRAIGFLENKLLVDQTTVTKVMSETTPPMHSVRASVPPTVAQTKAAHASTIPIWSSGAKELIVSFVFIDFL